jgi:hypothetical protein
VPRERTFASPSDASMSLGRGEGRHQRADCPRSHAGRRLGRCSRSPAEAYDRYMGRYSIPLAPRFCEFAQIAAEQRVLDVGCGPGALTAELVKRLGPPAVSAVDPSEPFVEAVTFCTTSWMSKVRISIPATSSAGRSSESVFPWRISVPRSTYCRRETRGRHTTGTTTPKRHSWSWQDSPRFALPTSTVGFVLAT